MSDYRIPTERLDISDLITRLCERLNAESKYVKQIDITPETATVIFYAGRDGFCKGPKYVEKDIGSPWYGQAVLDVRVVEVAG